MIRLFTALELPTSVRNRLEELQGGVPGARWTEPEDMHLTLRFIGEVDEDVAHDIDSVLSVLRAAPFEIALSGIGEFGGKTPRMLWAGVSKSEPLISLVQKIENAFQRLGLEPETRKYTPHVTLARLRDSPRAKVLDFIAHHNLFGTEPFKVTEFVLFSSHPSPHGHQYTPERKYPLENRTARERI
jgi:RNA 2',3'-cyclic 3'-phosphodiesterase